MTKFFLNAAIVAMDCNEHKTAYLLLCKALGRANRDKAPTGNIMRAMNALRVVTR